MSTIDGVGPTPLLTEPMPPPEKRPPAEEPDQEARNTEEGGIELSLSARRRSEMADYLAELRASFAKAPADKERGEAEEAKVKGAQDELGKDEEQEVEELRNREREVVAHENAHLAAAGGLATSGASYEYTTGPDGKRYVSGGEVDIQIEKGSNPQQTIQNAQKVQRAALAPTEPSGQDRRVAAKAAAAEQKARRELSEGEAGSEGPKESAPSELDGARGGHRNSGKTSTAVGEGPAGIQENPTKS